VNESTPRTAAQQELERRNLELGRKLNEFAQECLDADDTDELQHQVDQETEREETLTACYLSVGAAPSSPAAETPGTDRHPLDWAVLEGQTVPERAWAIEHWLPMSAVTLLSGAPGSGKSLVAQALASSLALQREYLDYPPAPRRVLMWACEDDPAELWRRQVAIAKWLNVSLKDFAGRFFLESFDSREVALASLIDQQLIPTPALIELRAQIGDYKADVVVLDNLARLYAGNENDRHQVTSFIAMLNSVATPTGAAVLLLGHPSKQSGSEYSGSTAWEAAVRARLYLGRHLPDEKPKDEDASEAPDQEEIRYLCRRKANYSSRDYRQIRYLNGVMAPEIDPREARSFSKVNPTSDFAKDCVLRAVRELTRMGMFPTASTASRAYLPKLAEQYGLLNGQSRLSFGATMRALQTSGALSVATVGKYPNRTLKHGLVIPDSSTNGSAK
jgi:hypothetical protein